ncbi:MAG: tRNA (adenosine(37)-N6)-threonylcarbamoyltransferase complex dimerization subunit type 1 TsaB [Synechococcaceae cyanobacterium]|jgi:tRNA threonylcarbamoyladenosine biosynthesis protein TsaB
MSGSPPACRWLLALHSSSDTLGLALQPLADNSAVPGAPRVETFALGRALANALPGCVEALLPASRWGELGRLAVAIGPGGFTGTRLTVVLARTLAQQLALPLDGIGSFPLIARRLLARSGPELSGGIWLIKELPRRGLVAGLYGADPSALEGVREWCAPRLYADPAGLTEVERQVGMAEVPRLAAEPSQPADVLSLLEIAQLASRQGRSAPWQTVLPLYPTSPVAPG